MYIIIKHVSRTAATQVPASPIFSLQINPPPDPAALKNNPITMTFDVVRHSKAVQNCDIYVCIILHRDCLLLLPMIIHQIKPLLKISKILSLIM